MPLAGAGVEPQRKSVLAKEEFAHTLVSPEMTEPAPLAHTVKPTLWRWVAAGLRATAGLSVLAPGQGPSAGQMGWVMLISSGLTAAASRLEFPGDASFLVRNWLFSWAPAALLLFGVWLMLQWGRRKSVVSDPVASWWLLYAVATVPMALLALGLSAAGTWDVLPVWWTESEWLAWGLFGLFWLWLLVSAWRVTRAVNRSGLVCCGVLLCVCAVQSADTWLLHTRYWRADQASQGQEGPETLVLSQEVFETQQALLAQAMQSLRPASSAEGVQPQVFALVYAPYSQDVFMRESAMVQEVLETRFAAKDRVVRLLNHPQTTDSIPWATTRNLEHSLQAIAKVMDLGRDVLVIYMTSHGGADFALSASHWPLEVPDLTASQLRTMLDGLGIRHRVIAVSACFSGGWIEPLEGDTTLVMTAADKDHTSYGCGSRSELTFFGRAVFDEQLRSKTLSFEDAFRASVPVIAQREVEGKKTDGFSNPQIAVGAGIKPVLARLEQGLAAAAGKDGAGGELPAGSPVQGVVQVAKP